MFSSPLRNLAKALCAALLISCTSVSLAQDTATSNEREQTLLGVLRSDAPSAEKALACKNLAIYGSSAAVDDLAKLLPDPQLSSWARTSLEAIPGPEADAALREAAGTLDGRLLIGMINSIGVRQDAAAVTTLVERLQSEDAQVAAAAAVALGKIGDEAATSALRLALKNVASSDSSPVVTSAIAEGCVLCAERRYLAGELASAIEIYDEIRAAEVPTQRMVEATRGAILSRGEDGIDLLLETFRSDEKKLRQLALATAREFPGDGLDKALAKEIVQADPPRAALIIQVMADRPDTVVLDSIVQAATQGDRQVRLSAIDALRRVGDSSCLSVLLKAAAENDEDVNQAAKDTLAELPGNDVDAKIVERLRQADGDDYSVLLHLVAQRRIDAVEDVVKALANQDATVRQTALAALGQIVSLQRLSLLIDAVKQNDGGDDLEAATKALRAACVRMPDREACAAELAAALRSARAATKTTLLEIISEVGGETALKTIYAAAMSSDPQSQDDGSRLLGKWNGVDAAPSLLAIAKSGPAEKYQVRALRGYIGLARKFPMPEPQRASMCSQAFELARRADEQRLVLDVLKLHPSLEGLGVAVKAKQVPAVRSEASQATMVIAQKLGDKGINVTELLSGQGLDPVKLEIVHAEYGADGSFKDVTKEIKQQAGNLPLIMLSSANYNSSFGGDPVPGSPKQLRIEYVINGKTGKATFKENAMILLPMPE